MIRYEANDAHGRDMPDPGRGKHLWIITAAWRVTDPATSRDPDGVFHMDRENLLTLAGPGCFKCERPWAPETERKWCNGV